MIFTFITVLAALATDDAEVVGMLTCFALTEILLEIILLGVLS